MLEDTIDLSVRRGALGRLLDRLRKNGYGVPRAVVRPGEDPAFLSVTLTVTGKPLSSKIRQGLAG